MHLPSVSSRKVTLITTAKDTTFAKDTTLFPWNFPSPSIEVGMYRNCILQGVLAGVTAMIQFSALDPISTPYLIPVSTLLSSFSPLSNKHSYCIISAPVLISGLSFNKQTLLHHVLYFFIYFSLSSITTIFPEIFLILLFVSVLFKMICDVILNKNLNTVSLEQVKIFKK